MLIELGSLRRVALTAIATLLVAACGGGGGGTPAPSGDGGGGTPAPNPNPNPSPNPNPNPPQVGDLNVSGTVTWDYVPATTGGLDYGNTEARPARGVTVELLSADDDLLASTATDVDGRFVVPADADTDVFLRVKAEMVASGGPAWDVRVRDNTQSDALYVLDGAVFNTGSDDIVEDLHAASGWNGLRYEGARAAAPFAILDLIYDAQSLLLGVDSTVEFPALDVFWSPDNRPEFTADGGQDRTTGELGTSYFTARSVGGEKFYEIYLLGAENSDTEEYDRHVIAHEWGHYFESAFSRADNIGGPHSINDRLDMRVAFGEGFGNALSAMITGDSLYKDVQGDQQRQTGGFDVEGAAIALPPAPGWFSERSVHELLYDLFDANQDTLDDTLALGFGPLYDVLRGVQASTPALTSIFSFIDALKARAPSEQTAIDRLVEAQRIDAVVDAYGTGETNDGNSTNGNVLPIYHNIAVNGPPVNVCSTDEFESSSTGGENKLGSRQFLKFTVTSPVPHTISAVTTSAPPGETTDPDMVLHRSGRFRESSNSPTPECEAGLLLQCKEVYTTPVLEAGDYVLEVYEWTNTEPADSDSPPIGRACFDVRITQ